MTYHVLHTTIILQEDYPSLMDRGHGQSCMITPIPLSNTRTVGPQLSPGTHLMLQLGGYFPS